MNLLSWQSHNHRLRPALSLYAQALPTFKYPSSDLWASQEKDFASSFLQDLWGLDWPSQKRRFQIMALLGKLSSPADKYYLERKTYYILPSLSPIFSSALWLEREIFDLFGVFFEAHGDLRRILTDYGFNSFPLRKDFPLTGYLELAYSPSSKTLFQRKVSLAQKRRFTAS